MLRRYLRARKPKTFQPKRRLTHTDGDTRISPARKLGDRETYDNGQTVPDFLKTKLVARTLNRESPSKSKYTFRYFDTIKNRVVTETYHFDDAKRFGLL
jgi:hypothetical protein